MKADKRKAEERKARLEGLNAWLEKSRGELDARVRQVFEKRFADRPEVCLLKFQYRFGYPKKKFRLRVEVAVDYGSLLAEGVFFRELPDVTLSCSEEEIFARFEEKGGFLLEDVVWKLPLKCSMKGKNQCTSPLFFRSTPKSGTCDRDEASFVAFSQTLAGQVLPELEGKSLDHVRTVLIHKQAEQSFSAPWLVPGHAEACRLVAGMEDQAVLTLHCEVRVRWWDASLESVDMTGRPIWTEATTWSEEDPGPQSHRQDL